MTSAASGASNLNFRHSEFSEGEMKGSVCGGETDEPVPLGYKLRPFSQHTKLRRFRS